MEIVYYAVYPTSNLAIIPASLTRWRMTEEPDPDDLPEPDEPQDPNGPRNDEVPSGD